MNGSRVIIVSLAYNAAKILGRNFEKYLIDTLAITSLVAYLQDGLGSSLFLFPIAGQK